MDEINRNQASNNERPRLQPVSRTVDDSLVIPINISDPGYGGKPFNQDPQEFARKESSTENSPVLPNKESIESSEASTRQRDLNKGSDKSLFPFPSPLDSTTATANGNNTDKQNNNAVKLSDKLSVEQGTNIDIQGQTEASDDSDIPGKKHLTTTTLSDNRTPRSSPRWPIDCYCYESYQPSENKACQPLDITVTKPKKLEEDQDK